MILTPYSVGTVDASKKGPPSELSSWPLMGRCVPIAPLAAELRNEISAEAERIRRRTISQETEMAGGSALP